MWVVGTSGAEEQCSPSVLSRPARRSTSGATWALALDPALEQQLLVEVTIQVGGQRGTLRSHRVYEPSAGVDVLILHELHRSEAVGDVVGRTNAAESCLVLHLCLLRVACSTCRRQKQVLDVACV